jgi:Protein kinase domain.
MKDIFNIIGKKIGNYKIVDLINEGGNSFIYKVSFNNKFYALKLSKRKPTKEVDNRFANEIKFQKESRSKYIVTVLDYGICNLTFKKKKTTRSYYVMPLYMKNFKEVLKDNKIPIDKKISYYLDVCNGLEYAHSQKVFHRDIKPENIFFDDKNNIMVLGDFGIAHFIGKNNTKTNEKLANFSYCSPEQKSREKVTYKTDIYSMGLILNEIFTNTIPSGNNYIEIKEKFPLYSGFDQIVENMLEYDANRRPESISDVKDEINIYINILESNIDNIKEFLKKPDFINPNAYKISIEDIALLKSLVNYTNKSIFNDCYHNWIYYKVDKQIVDLLFLYRLDEIVENKICYEANSNERVDIIFNGYENEYFSFIKTLYIKGYESYAEKIYKKMVILKDYHIKEIIENMKEEYKNFCKNREFVPIIGVLYDLIDINLEFSINHFDDIENYII